MSYSSASGSRVQSNQQAFLFIPCRARRMELKVVAHKTQERRDMGFSCSSSSFFFFF